MSVQPVNPRQPNSGETRLSRVDVGTIRWYKQPEPGFHKLLILLRDRAGTSNPSLGTKSLESFDAL
jgi:hypothetical protein